MHPGVLDSSRKRAGRIGLRFPPAPARNPDPVATRVRAHRGGEGRGFEILRVGVGDSAHSVRKTTHAVDLVTLREQRLHCLAIGALAVSFRAGETGSATRPEASERAPRRVEIFLSPEGMAVSERLHPIRQCEILVALLCGLERLRRILVLEAVKQRDTAKEVGLRFPGARVREHNVSQSRMRVGMGMGMVFLRVGEIRRCDEGG